jgi:predicted nucleotidyltransferase
MTPSATYENGLWGGRTLPEWAPEVVDEIVHHANPRQVVLFGSVARGHSGPDSDIDVLVVLDDQGDRPRWRHMADLRSAIRLPVPLDLLVTDVDELAAADPRSVFAAALRDGTVTYERPR